MSKGKYPLSWEEEQQVLKAEESMTALEVSNSRYKAKREAKRQFEQERKDQEKMAKRSKREERSGKITRVIKAKSQLQGSMAVTLTKGSVTVVFKSFAEAAAFIGVDAYSLSKAFRTDKGFRGYYVGGEKNA